MLDNLVAYQYTGTLKFLAKFFAVFLFISSLFFSVTNYCDTHHVGLAYNRFSGESFVQGPGIHFTAPWTSVSRIDIRPQRLCVESAARSSKCLLVQFKKDAFRDLISAEGFRYYWWDNRFSYNSGHKEEYRGFRDLMLGYAYTNATFLTVKEEF